jgi:hypothetical protein
MSHITMSSYDSGILGSGSGWDGSKGGRELSGNGDKGEDWETWLSRPRLKGGGSEDIAAVEEEKSGAKAALSLFIGQIHDASAEYCFSN